MFNVYHAFAIGVTLFAPVCAHAQLDVHADDCNHPISLLQESLALRQRITQLEEHDSKSVISRNVNDANSASLRNNATGVVIFKDNSSLVPLFFGVHHKAGCGINGTWFPPNVIQMWENETTGESEQLFSIGLELQPGLEGDGNTTPSVATSSTASAYQKYLGRSNPGKLRELDMVFITENGTIGQPKTCTSWCITYWCKKYETDLNRSILLNWSRPVYDRVITLAAGRDTLQPYHGPIDIMSSLVFVDPKTLSSDKTKIQVPAKTDYVMAWFELLGIPSDRIIEGSIWAKHVFVPEWRLHNPSLHQYHWLQTRLWHTTGPPDIASRNTLIVMKRKYRGASNHDSVVLPLAQEFASSHKLHIFVHDDTSLPSVQEQIEIFKNAKMIIAPHGAGEAFLIGTAPGACLVEMLKPMYAMDDYARQSTLLGLHYVAMPLGKEDGDNLYVKNVPVDGNLLRESMAKCAKALRL